MVMKVSITESEVYKNENWSPCGSVDDVEEVELDMDPEG